MRRATRRPTDDPPPTPSAATDSSAGPAEADVPDDDLLWDLDLTRVRPSNARFHRTSIPAPQAVPERAPAPSRAVPAVALVSAPRAPQRPHRRGRFHRPELESGWERFARSRIVQAAGAALLLAGTATLVIVALTR